ncbi:tyrosine-protein kinase receptor Tie-1 isoform 2-T2 [Leptodactylus fuscus]
MLRLLHPLILVIGFLLSTKTGAVLDVTLVSFIPEHRKDLTLSCVTGERDMVSSDLHIERDNKIVLIPSKRPIKTKSLDKEVKASGISGQELVGVFFCTAKGPSEETKILFPYNSPYADLIPVKVTVTVSVNDHAELQAKVIRSGHPDILWKYNGTFLKTTYKNDVSNGIAQYNFTSVQLSHAGIYSAGFMGASPLVNAFFRLIVRGCPANKWGPSCQKDCLDCLNGGVCHDSSGECICAPGFMGTQCEKECPPGTYGANCALKCQCNNGGSCNRFSGCECRNGWHGQHCEKSDHLPQIIDLVTPIEFNLNSSATLSCAASGKPQPVLESIVLRRPDGSVLSANQAVMDPERSTCTFNVTKLTLSDHGFWECRVSTSGGQDSRKFEVLVRVPPKPLEPPRLLARGSKYLILAPLRNFTGDGPISSIKLLYQPEEDKNQWSNIVVDRKDNITLPNLKPVTAYRVQFQLKRPGDGGVGPLGPEAVLYTDCTEPTVRPEIKDHFIVDRNSISINWQLPSYKTPGNGFLVRIYHPSNHLYRQENITSIKVLSARIYGLSSKTKYTFRVLIYHCTSLGPPSDPYTIVLNSKGPSPPKDVRADRVSRESVKLIWSPPEDPNGGIIKYTVESWRLGAPGEQQWADTEGHNQTWYIISGLNTSTEYQFRVRANSKVPGEWSHSVTAVTYSDEPSRPLSDQAQSIKPSSSGQQQLILAIIGSVSVTCFTIIVALLALFCIKKNLFHRRRMFTYQSGSGEETILQFSSGTLTLTRRPRPQTEPFSYPILEWADIKFEDVIGEGNFGQVIKAMIKKDGVRMNAAIKMLKEFASENDHRDFAGELEVLCKLGHHPNIINLLGACENRGYLYIAIEYAPYGNLLDFLRKSRVLETDPAFAKEHGTASTLTSQQLLQFASDVAKGMQYLSEKQFIHRDLAARNVLVGENLAAKIADFGLSRGEEVYVKKTMGRLPVRWMAIESLNYSVYTTKSDVWSFGVLLWEIVSLGGTPYCGMTCAELYEKLPQGYRMEKPRNCDDEVYELMRQCWRDRPYERPPFTQISLQLIRMLEARKAYVNMALFENFTYAGIDATAEEA